MSTLLAAFGGPCCPAMINSIHIQNFKCFKRLQIDSCKAVNIIVGENGTGKTALLEAMFLTLGGSTSLAMRLRQQRGYDGSIQGATAKIEEALWGELFNDWGAAGDVVVKLVGDGPEARSLTISRMQSASQVSLLTGAESSSAAVEFTWVDSEGEPHSVSPRLTANKLDLPNTTERNPDFFLFGANQTSGSADMAARYSQLRDSFADGPFTDFIKSEYPFIESLEVAVVAGMPALSAKLVGQKKRLPFNAISSGLSRVAQLALALFDRHGGVVLVDEIENGIYYKHHAGIWRGLLNMAKSMKTQLFISSHSAECLDALASVASADMVEEIALWRLERNESHEPVLRQFSGTDMMAAV